MHSQSLINKKIVKNNYKLKITQKKEKQKYGKGNRKIVKNYLGKVVALSSPELIGKELRMSDFTTNITRDELIGELEKVKITGMSGNSFFLSEKIKKFCSLESDKRILLINAVECDPGLIHDEWILENRYSEIVHSIHYLKEILSLKEVIMVSKNKRLEKDGSFSLKTVSSRYPMGEEHFLIQQVLGINLDTNEFPVNNGILVLNLQSVYQICKIINKCYDTGRFITIADLSNGSARVAYIYPTDNISNILKSTFKENEDKLLYKGNGVMSCFEATEKDDFSYFGNFAAYSKTSNISNKNKCKKCGVCTRKCPAKVNISKIVQIIDNNYDVLLSSYHPERCIHCGSCTYYCKASKNVAEYVMKDYQID